LLGTTDGMQSDGAEEGDGESVGPVVHAPEPVGDDPLTPAEV
jgi:hypothetical protein